MSGLQVIGLTGGYLSTPVLREVTLSVGDGEAVCVIGSNGAGKSTLLRAISGLVPWHKGQILFNGVALGGKPHSRARLGIAHVPEGRWVFPEISVRDHLVLGGRHVSPRQRREQMERVIDLFPRLEALMSRHAGTLSGGEQQMVAIGRAVMGQPRLLMLDEPSLGLAPILVQRIFDVLRELHAQGLTILLVEQNARLALRFATRGYVLRSGRVVVDGPAGSLLENEGVQQAYLGRDSRVRSSNGGEDAAHA